MEQQISIVVRGTFPRFEIEFSADPLPVPRESTAVFTYTLASPGFRLVGVNLQREPFRSQDELTWTLPAERQSVILKDQNKDWRQTFFGIELLFEDSAGNQFSSADPQVENEGFPP
jgi:hypothetical protein